MLQELGIMLRLFPPVRVWLSQNKLPHHAAEEAVGPLRPFLPRVPPFSVRGIHGKEIGMRFDQRPHLPRGKIEGMAVGSELLWQCSHDCSLAGTKPGSGELRKGSPRDSPGPVWSRLNPAST